MTPENKYPALGKVYIIPEITEEQYNAVTEVLSRFPDIDIKAKGISLSEAASREILSIAVIEEGEPYWTPEIGKKQFESFKRFPMKAKIEILKVFFYGYLALMSEMGSASIGLMNKSLSLIQQLPKS